MHWKPKTTAELQQALKDNSIPHESAFYEYKQQLPHSAKTYDIAVDVSAMTVDGGIIIYGVGEDKQKVSFFEHPIELQGVNDRISNTVNSNVREPPAFDIQLLKLENDPTKGFVIVEVPASPLAPHMVEVQGEYRFYGRVPGGNTALTETQIARLYERRHQIENQGQEIVNTAIAAAPIQVEPGTRSDLHIVFRPLLADSGVRLRAFGDDDGKSLARAVTESCNTLRFTEQWDPRVDDILIGGDCKPTLDGIMLYNRPTRGSDGSPILEDYAQLEVLDGGLARYFRAAIAREELTGHDSQQKQFVIQDLAMSQIVARLAHMVGHYLRKAQYQSSVDVYIAILGAKGAVSNTTSTWGSYSTQAVGTITTDDYRNEIRATVDELADDPTAISRKLLDRLLRTIRPSGVPDPLSK